jgi:hypothetical protein
MATSPPACGVPAICDARHGVITVTQSLLGPEDLMGVPQVAERLRTTVVAQPYPLLLATLSGSQRSGLDEADVAFHQREYERLSRTLEAEMAASRLPETASAKRALDELLIRVRLASLDGIRA